MPGLAESGLLESHPLAGAIRLATGPSAPVWFTLHADPFALRDGWAAVRGTGQGLVATPFALEAATAPQPPLRTLGGIRTLNIHALNVATLPIGLREHGPGTSARPGATWTSPLPGAGGLWRDHGSLARAHRAHPERLTGIEPATSTLARWRSAC